MGSTECTLTSVKSASPAPAKKKFDFIAAHFRCERDKFSESNPSGYVNFGSAQNFLHKDRLANRFADQAASPEDFSYQLFYGTDASRAAVAQYLGAIAGVPVSADDIVIGNGVISLLESLSIALMKPGQRILIPTPVFPGLVNALRRTDRVETVWLHADPQHDFQLRVEDFERELESHSAAGTPLRAVLLCSPGNPIGQVFDQSELESLIELTQRFDCYLIVDEIYASSCFESATFQSAITAGADHVFVIGGLSKDFGLAGYATGWVHGIDPEVMQSMRGQAHFYRLPAPVARSIEHALSPDWRDDYLTEHRQRLTTAHREVVQVLSNSGIPVAATQSGLCVWLDLRNFMSVADHDGEMWIYQQLLDNHRVHLSPGSGFFTPHHGFFRICFSQRPDTLTEGLNRITSGLAKIAKR